MRMPEKIRSIVYSAAAVVLLSEWIAVPAQAVLAPYLTPDSTVAELHANEGIVGSGFDSWDRGSLWPEQPWEYANWTLRQYTGDTAADAVAGLNLIIDNYNNPPGPTRKSTIFPPRSRGRNMPCCCRGI